MTNEVKESQAKEWSNIQAIMVGFKSIKQKYRNVWILDIGST
jgi:hypothetical protein